MFRKMSIIISTVLLSIVRETTLRGHQLLTAVLLPRDQLHDRAKAASEAFLHDATILTSDLVIVEVLNYLHAHSIEVRQKRIFDF